MNAYQVIQSQTKKGTTYVALDTSKISESEAGDDLDHFEKKTYKV